MPIGLFFKRYVLILEAPSCSELFSEDEWLVPLHFEIYIHDNDYDKNDDGDVGARDFK